MASKTEKNSLPEFLNRLMDTPFAIVVAKKDGKVLQSNTHFQNMFEHSSDEHENIRNWLSEASLDNFHTFLRRLEGRKRETDLPSQDTMVIVDKSGKNYYLELGAYLSHDVNKHYLVGILITGSGRDRIQPSPAGKTVQRQKMKEKLQQELALSELKSRFISIASHEFRTPLAGITSSLNLIQRYIKADQEAWNQFRHHKKIDNHYRKIQESVRMLDVILNKFLSLQNIEKGEIPMKWKNIDPVKLIQKQVDQYRQLTKPGQRITYQHEGSQRRILLDRNIFKNILNNLLSNASKFSAEDSDIQVNSRYEEKTFRIDITDQGIGIPEREQEKIFRRFFRAENALAYGEGTGLGLHIVKKYLELLDGQIHFDSKQNKGTTFTIILPEQQQ